MEVCVQCRHFLYGSAARAFQDTPYEQLTALPQMQF